MLFFLNKRNHCHIENTIFRGAHRERELSRRKQKTEMQSERIMMIIIIIVVMMIIIMILIRS